MRRRQISIPDEIDQYLSERPNASGYITQLVRADMENEPLTRDEVIKIINEIVNRNASVDDDIMQSIRNFI